MLNKQVVKMCSRWRWLIGGSNDRLLWTEWCIFASTKTGNILTSLININWWRTPLCCGVS